MSAQTLPRPAVIYPDSDGEPMAENTLQFREIVRLEGNLDALFQDDPSVFVAGDLLWYAVERRPDICLAPDAMVIFGRPKGYRGSYKQWEEDGIAPQAVFEVLSPGNRFGKMLKKFEFYELYGVEEYYLFDPDAQTLEGWIREGNKLRGIPEMNGWVSPRLGIRFEVSDGEVRFFRPDGQPFLTFVEIHAQWQASRKRAIEQETRADQERARAEQERAHAIQAHEQAEQDRQLAARERQRAEKMAAKLRELGLDPDA